MVFHGFPWFSMALFPSSVGKSQLLESQGSDSVEDGRVERQHVRRRTAQRLQLLGGTFGTSPGCAVRWPTGVWGLLDPTGLVWLTVIKQTPHPMFCCCRVPLAKKQRPCESPIPVSESRRPTCGRLCVTVLGGWVIYIWALQQWLHEWWAFPWNKSGNIYLEKTMVSAIS